MQHEFSQLGQNAFLSSHVCDICGLVVTTAKSQSSVSLPLEGCVIRSDAVPAPGQWSSQDRK